MNPTLSQQWQQMSYDQEILSWCVTQHMGLNFMDTKTAHQWRTLNRDERFFRENGDHQMADWTLEQMDKLIEQDEQQRLLAESYLAKMRARTQGQAGLMEVAL